MDFFLQDNHEEQLPPQEVRLRSVRAVPQAGGKKVRIFLELSPFEKRPNLEVTITNEGGKEVAHTNILEAVLRKMDFTMHLRQAEPGFKYKVRAIVYYQKLPFPSQAPVELPLPEPEIVDQQEITITLPALDT